MSSNLCIVIYTLPIPRERERERERWGQEKEKLEGVMALLCSGARGQSGGLATSCTQARLQWAYSAFGSTEQLTFQVLKGGGLGWVSLELSYGSVSTGSSLSLFVGIPSTTTPARRSYTNGILFWDSFRK